MARRKANVTPRVRPSQALKGPTTPDNVTPIESVAHKPSLEDLPEQPSPPEEEHFIGEMMSDRILNNVFSQPVIPDDIMQDNPFPGQQPDRGDMQLAPLEEPEPRPETADLRDSADDPGTGGGSGGDRRDHPVLAPLTRYTQRITINDAYQFTGRVQTAPPWIDKNWLSYDDVSSAICLHIPKVGTCLKGDYIVQQRVVLNEHGVTEDRIAIYPKDDFERLFMAVPS